jgi:hypothetical protein
MAKEPKVEPTYDADKAAYYWTMIYRTTVKRSKDAN